MPNGSLTNAHNVDYYELLVYEQPVSGDRLFCTHVAGSVYNTQVVATCKSYTTEDADRVTTTVMASCTSANSCQFNDEASIAKVAVGDTEATWSKRTHHQADTGSGGWDSNPNYVTRSAAATVAECAKECLLASFKQLGCHSFDFDTDTNGCVLYQPAYSAANQIVLTEHKEHYDLRAMSQAVITTAEKCTHKEADKADVGIVSQCRNRLWRTSCIALTRVGGSDLTCTWNPYYFGTGDYTAGSWNRMRGREISSDTSAPLLKTKNLANV